jgi:glycolate oxidase FAD binding subunit
VVVSQLAVEPLVDGLRPELVLRPTSACELATELSEAACRRASVIPVGGGRALGMGDPPISFDVALRTDALAAVIEYRPDDFSVTVEAGIRLDDLRPKLAAHGQFVALDPFGGPGHSVGGVLASGLGGPLRLGCGPLRDQLLGLRVALPDGTLPRSGSRVLKNVAGYDVHKLHIGAMGCLGVIVEVTLRTWPLWRCDTTLASAALTLVRAWTLASRALAIRPVPMALVITGEESCGWRVLARYGGAPSAVAGAKADLGWGETIGTCWEQLSELTGAVWARVAVPPPRLSDLLPWLPSTRLVIEPASGIAHCFDPTDPAELARLRAAAEAMGGSLVLLAAPVELKRQLGSWGSRPANHDLMQRLRDVFDPGRTLSPGRGSL